MTRTKAQPKYPQVPINQRTLLTLGSFISYCSDNGFRIKSEELEFLHKEGLFYPALKIYRGVAVSKKILINKDGSDSWVYIDPEDIKKFKVIKSDPKKYYSSGGFFMSGDNWLDYYEKNKMIEKPVDNKFKLWINTPTALFITDIKKIDKSYELFYDKYQFLALKIVNKYLKYWHDFNKKEKTKYKQQIIKRISEYYNFLAFYYEAEKLYFRILEQRDKHVKVLKETDNSKQEIKEEIKVTLKPVWKKAVERMISDFNIDVNFIKEWRSFLADQNLINEASYSYKIKRAYFQSLQFDYFINAQDSNKMILVLNSILYLLTREEATVKSVLGNLSHHNCIICGVGFNPKKETQVTCGDPLCIRANKNNIKKMLRKRK